jgi:glyoxylase-like metal-dependent hydrolase (beta-lactamase superfamily II)
MNSWTKLITAAAFVLSLCFPVLNQQQQSATQQSFLKARPVLEAGIKAMGGLEALQGLSDVTRELSGIRSDEGQGMQPVLSRGGDPPATSHPKVKSIRDLRNQRTVDDLDDAIFGGQPLKIHSVITGNNAFSINDVIKGIRQVPPAGINNARVSRFRRNPESLLLSAWNRPENLRWLGDTEFEGRKQRAISIADADGAEVALFFDAQTNLLTKTEFLTDDQVLGDVTQETIYSDWRPVEKVSLPFRYVDRIAGVTSQDLRVSSIVINTHPSDSLFSMPDGYAKIDLPPSTPNVKKLGDDVYAIMGPYNSIFVVFKDYVLVVEAGFNNRYSQSSIAEIKKVAPDRPIRYLVSTHFHFDHLSGVRSYIAEGTTIVTTADAKVIIEKAAGASHVMRPDALSRNPKRPVIEVMEAKRVFTDGNHTVELYQIANPHVGQMIIAWLPKEKLLFEADMLDIPEAGNPPAGDDTIDLAEKIEKLGLQVETIIPVHGRIGKIDDLRQAVSSRTSRK